VLYRTLACVVDLGCRLWASTIVIAPAYPTNRLANVLARV